MSDETGHPNPENRATDFCRECGKALGAGYLCDDCDELEVLDE